MKEIYVKTRYQNIYRHKKNNNYIIMISKPKKTSISKINNEKIYDIEVAKKYKIKLELDSSKIVKQSNSLFFKDLWINYINHCENVSKLAYNTLKKKHSIYNCFLKDLDNIKIPNLTKQSIADYISNLPTTDKQKNTCLTILKGFMTWCVDQEVIPNNPTSRINYIKVNKSEMRYWTVEQFQKFMKFISSIDNECAQRIKMFVYIELTLGDRPGETRALTWDSFNEEHSTTKVLHSIEYNPKTNDYLKVTKNYQSERVVDVSDKFINSINEYKQYLIDLYGDINNIIFWNYAKNKPYSDTALRKQFYKYCDLANVPKIRPYDLRHTYVALMMNEGWELYHISRRIGHKNYATTVDKYGHLEDKVRKEIAKTTDKYF